MQRSVLWKLLLVFSCVTVLTLVYAERPLAYESYHDPNTPDEGYCASCHSGFVGRGPVHDLHTDWFVDDCSLCHTGSGRDNPLTVWSASTNPRGYGCSGCHGRDQGETIQQDYRGFPVSGLGKMSAYGLRKRHAANGVGVCADCHDDQGVCVVPELMQPVYYTAPYFGAGLTFVDDPCNANGFEDGTGDGQGLDNDGDTLYDLMDPDCTGCIDADNDGWGAVGDPSCPSGAEPDCDDCNAAVNPGVADEDDPTLCSDGLDNDCDGGADLDDPDGNCAADPCGDGTCDAGAGEDPCTCAADCPLTADETNACTNACDDDGDGCTDGVDADCGGTEDCATAGDQDCDGLDDGADPDCDACGDGTCDAGAGENPCTCAADCPLTADETNACSNACDDDGDGCTDDVDADCGGTEDCATAGDQDCDGLDDGADPDCGQTDTDGDGVLDDSDVCSRAWDPLQQDGDGDGLGDACDPDDEVIPMVAEIAGGGDDLVLRWQKTPPDPRDEYQAYTVYRGDLGSLAQGTPAAPNYSHTFQACVLAPERLFTEPGIRNGTDSYYLVVGWDLDPAGGPWEGTYGWSDVRPLGGTVGAEDVQRERSRPAPDCP